MLRINKILFFVLNLILFSSFFAQGISIGIKNSHRKKAVLIEIIGDKVNEIDTVFAQKNNFIFSLEGKHSGLYQLRLDKRHFLNFVNDNEVVEINTDFNNLLDSMKINKSESNKLYYSFLKLNKVYKIKSELLNLILQRYPKNDDYYQITQQKLAQIQKEYLRFVNILSQKNPASFIARYVYSSRLPVVESSLPFNAQINYLKEHALDKVDFNDETLCYSDLFTNKAIEYLTYYRNTNLPKKLLEKEFTRAVDTLLFKARTNRIVLKQITEYLIDGFRKFGFDNIIDYIIENYVIKYHIPLDEKLETSLQRRIDQAKFLSIGATVPDIALKDTSGNLTVLSKVKTDKILVVFYASWCPHCQKSVSQIVKLYNSQKEKKLEVFAVSIDKQRDEWVNFIKKYKANWINVSDLKGWNSKAASDYYVFATPTMFLINNHRKLLSKPMTIDEVQKIFLTK